MAFNTKFFSIKINPRNFEGKLKFIEKSLLPIFKQTTDQVANSAVIRMKAIIKSSYIRQRTGTLINSVGIIRKITASGGTSLRSRVLVGATARHASYHDGGTKPSSGRFVPFLGRKLITKRGGFGIHPGVRAIKFTEKTIAQVNAILPAKSGEMLSKWKMKWDTLQGNKK